MELLGIGPLELMLIGIVALLVIKPEDWGRTARTLAKWADEITSSDWWRAMSQSWRAASEFSVELKRDINLEKTMKHLGEPYEAMGGDNWKTFDANDAEQNVILPPQSKPFTPYQSVQPPKAKATAKSAARKPAGKKSQTSARKKPKTKKHDA